MVGPGERLGLLRVKDDVLVLHAMRWPDEIRDPTELLPPAVTVPEGEIEAALALMDTMTIDSLEGEEFVCRYTEAIAQIIEAKREEKPLPKAAEPEEPAPVLDLMAALNASIEQARASRGEGEAEVHEMPKPQIKAAAIKPAGKAPARKTAAKKQATRKPRRSA
ncbi:hypothetical protein [Streptomyces sp. NPDC002671]